MNPRFALGAALALTALSLPVALPAQTTAPAHHVTLPLKTKASPGNAWLVGDLKTDATGSSQNARHSGRDCSARFAARQSPQQTALGPEEGTNTQTLVSFPLEATSSRPFSGDVDDATGNTQFAEACAHF
jgi:hypothetical protein